MSASVTGSPRRTSRRPTRLALGGLTLVALLLAACGGGGGGGGGGGSAYQLKTMVINLSGSDAKVGVQGQAEQVVPQCDFKEVDFPLNVPFVLTVNGQPAIDSNTLEGGVPGNGQVNVLSQITISKDGKVNIDKKPYNGSSVVGPSRLYVNSSCANPKG